MRKKPSKKLQFNRMLDRLARRQKGLHFAVGDWIAKVKDPREGEDTGTQLNAIDTTTVEKAEKLIVEVFLYQEMGKIFGLDPAVQDKMLTNLIDKRIPKPILSLTRPLPGGVPTEK